jgi:hypothetical protein
MLQSMKRRKPWFKLSTMNNLFWFHIFFAGVYYVMTLQARSDSVGYYNRALYEHEHWFSAFSTGTRFIDFVGYPFINFFKFNYEMMMVLFSWFGYWGFVYFYIFFKENIRYKHKFQGIDLITLFIFLPNMHYWTASFGKGALIFLALAMVVYALSNLKTRKFSLIFGLILVYYIRPHIFLFLAIAIVVGIFTGKQKVPFYQKFIVLVGSATAIILMYDQILGFVGLDSQNLVESFDQFSSKRSFELAKANSGIDTSNYPVILKLFTFWFRPLFIDAPGPVGIIVSFENLLYLYLALQLFSGKFIKFMAKSSALVKTSAVVFLATSFALSETLSNMGIIIRQKSMVMYFLLFIILAFMDYKKGVIVSKKMRALALRKKNEEDIKPQLIQA